MARISGIVGPRSTQAETFEHPKDRTFTFAQGRLAVAGHDPKAFEDPALILVLDGIVFNRAELPSAKHDAECLARLYQAVGFVKMLQMLNGDFALALWDKNTQTLWLGRDRLGVRPLYYAQGRDCLSLGSLPASLFHTPGLQLRLRRDYVALVAGSHYRTFDNRPALSPYEGLSQLPAAHWLSYQVDSAALQTGVYWALKSEPDWTLTETELAKQYRELLTDAVAQRLKVSQNPAFTLSGGMDSSSVLACAVQVSGQKQAAFSSVYQDPTYDERAEIHSMLDSCVSRWYPVSVEPTHPLETIQKLVALHQEPVATATWLSHALICEEVKNAGFDTLFGGLGGDELNAGEFEYFFCYFADLQQSGQTELLQQEIAGWAKHHDHPIYKKNPEVAEKTMARLFDTQHPGLCKPDRARLERYLQSLNPAYFELTAFEPQMLHPLGTCLNNRTWQDLFYETMPCCLRAQDRHGEATGLSHLTPFLDYRLLELMFRVPGRLKIREGVTKILLREAMKGVLPEETRTRVKKTGWNAPAHLWFAGQQSEPIWDLLRSERFRSRDIYNYTEVERLYSDHLAIVEGGLNRENHMMFFWQLLNLEYWLQWSESQGVAF